MTPEDSIKIQEYLMAFDHRLSINIWSMELSMRCKEAHQSQSALFGIVQNV